VHCSPGVPRGTTAPVSGSTTLISTCGCARPTVPTRFSSGSSAAVCVETGEVSVIPQRIVTSSMCMRVRTLVITSTGHGAPPISPVLRLERSNRSKPGSSSSAMNIVGTP
jgi:hypothetical protein